MSVVVRYGPPVIPTTELDEEGTQHSFQRINEGISKKDKKVNLLEKRCEQLSIDIEKLQLRLGQSEKTNAAGQEADTERVQTIHNLRRINSELLSEIDMLKIELIDDRYKQESYEDIIERSTDRIVLLELKAKTVDNLSRENELLKDTLKMKQAQLEELKKETRENTFSNFMYEGSQSARRIAEAQVDALQVQYDTLKAEYDNLNHRIEMTERETSASRLQDISTSSRENENRYLQQIAESIEQMRLHSVKIDEQLIEMHKETKKCLEERIELERKVGNLEMKNAIVNGEELDNHYKDFIMMHKWFFDNESDPDVARLGSTTLNSLIDMIQSREIKPPTRYEYDKEVALLQKLKALKFQKEGLKYQKDK